MVPTETEIAENLRDAGCRDGDVNAILDSLRRHDARQADLLIQNCRNDELRRLHESQQRIDRLDYLRYRLTSNR